MMLNLTLVFRDSGTLTVIFVILLLTGCSQPANYAPVKTVNEEFLPEGVARPRPLDKLAHTKARPKRPEKLAKDTLIQKRSDNMPLKPHVKEPNGVSKNQRIFPPGVVKQGRGSNEAAPALSKTLKNKGKTAALMASSPETDEIKGLTNARPKHKGQTLESELGQAEAKGESRLKKSSNKLTDKEKNDSDEKNNDEKTPIISNINKKVLKLNFEWPVRGKVVRNFAQSDNKGIDIAGKTGQQVLAAESGKAVYCGSGLKGYGNLIIIKHNQAYLSAYAHNKRLSVKEGQSVGKGQPIGEVGLAGFKQPILHFEIRKNGKSINPLTLLPKY